MEWRVSLTKRADKQKSKLPGVIRSALRILMADIESLGPVRGDWPNYGKLGSLRHHCHIKKGQPTYVAVWEERENEIRFVEVTYVGTHEKAPY